MKEKRNSICGVKLKKSSNLSLSISQFPILILIVCRSLKRRLELDLKEFNEFSKLSKTETTTTTKADGEQILDFTISKQILSEYFWF